MPNIFTKSLTVTAVAFSLLLAPTLVASKDREKKPDYSHLRGEWPVTDFEKASVPVAQILSGGPPRDGIRSIDDPKFVPARLIRDISDTEPVISVKLGGDVKAYPFRILIQHEIVNDIVGGLPIAVTYCPLCNSAFVFARQIGGRAVEFGTTGRLYNSNLVMYDRLTESWWAQFTGEAIVGELTGAQLHRLPARIESFAKFRARNPMGDVLVPPDNPRRSYGLTPYAGYDSLRRPWFPVAELPKGLSPMARVVTVGDRAWSLRYVRKKGPIETDDGLVISWERGQNSVLDKRKISRGADVGNVLVQQRTADGLLDVAYGVDFAFAFQSFYPDGIIVTK